MPPISERRAALAQALILLALAAAWRLFLCGRYFGWEESDYGNVMMVRKVMDSGYRWFPPQHMPGFYALGALAREVWPAPRGSALAMTMALSCAGVSVAALVARKMVGPSAGWLLGLWLAFQPEMALYGASQVHFPVFASIGFAGLALLYWGGRCRGFGLVALAFLVRMDGFFSLFPAAIWSAWRDAGERLRRLVVPIAVLAGAALGWQFYVTVGHGDSFFVWAVLDINRAPDVHGGELGSWDWRGWFLQAFQTVWWLATWTIPRKLGWSWVVLAIVGCVALWTGTGRPGSRSAVAFGVTTAGFLFGTAFLAHHEPNHNLYWAWLTHCIPFVGLLAAGGWGWLERRLMPAPVLARRAAFAAVLLSAIPPFVSETRYQMARSDAWYRPQLELSTWLEEETPPGTGVLVSSIPEVWLTRQPSSLRIYSWWTLPDRARGLDPAGFGAFLAEERIDYVMWFVEEWNDAAAVAPWMVAGRNVAAGPVGLTATDREDGYGWILYVVARPGAPIPKVPPPFGQGHRGRGWRGVR